MPSSSRTFEWPPSAAIRYWPESSRSLPPSTSRTVSVTPEPSWRSAVTSVPCSISAPAVRAFSRRMGSRLGWFRNQRWQGLTASTPSLRLEMMSASLRPETQSMAISAPSGTNSFADSSRTRASMPSSRNISSVRMWKKAARGRGELSFRRSTVIERMPCCARKDAMARPVSPPPAIRTGASLLMVAPIENETREYAEAAMPPDWRRNAGSRVFTSGIEVAPRAGPRR